MGGRGRRRGGGGVARAQWSSQQETGRAEAGRRGRPGAGLSRAAAATAVAHCAAGGPRASGPGTDGLLGMVSKALLRLVSAVNRRRMKLLLGIALLAYVACE